MKLSLALVALFVTACASNKIIRDDRYQPAVEAYGRGEPDAALERFPSGEEHGFITSTEKAWLGLWAGQGHDRDLAKQAPSFDDRHFVSLSREAGVFLFQESEEGYVPSEHEAVVFHLLRAIYFHREKNLEEAAVELRQAGYILDRTWDDPALRLWLGTLWAANGDWNEAQVDFRRADELSPSAEAAKLSRLKSPPRNLNLHFYGNSPVMKWPEGQFAPDFAEDTKPSEGGYSSLPWFVRHTKRNSELRDVILKSNFMAQYLGDKALTNTERGVGHAVTGAIKITAIAVGTALTAAVLYLAAQSNVSGDGLGYLLAGSVGAGVGIWNAGEDFHRDFKKTVNADEERKMKALRVYRLVRFLPSWIRVDIKPSVNATRSIDLSSRSETKVELWNHF